MGNMLGKQPWRVAVAGRGVGHPLVFIAWQCEENAWGSTQFIPALHQVCVLVLPRPRNRAPGQRIVAQNVSSSLGKFEALKKDLPKDIKLNMNGNSIEDPDGFKGEEIIKIIMNNSSIHYLKENLTEL